MFDWKSRFSNKTFLVSFFAALLVFAQLVLQPFGINLPNDYLTTTFNALLVLLGLLGIVIDPTTAGITDRFKRANMPNRHYKLQKDSYDSRDAKFEHLVTPAPAVDLRPYCPPIDDQGNLGSCTANALVGVMGFLMIKLKVPFVKLSRLFAYFEERELEGTVSTDSGASIRDECKVAIKGVCEESLMIYNVANFTVPPSEEALANAPTHKITSYKAVKGIAGIKQALTLGYVVAIGMSVYESFESAIVASTGKVPMPKKNEKLKGGHAVVVVGYDDKKSVLIVRNSWGEGWGDKGCFYLPYTYVPKYTYDYWLME